MVNPHAATPQASGVTGAGRMLTGLLDASHLAALDQVPALVAEHAPHAGLGEVLIYLVDLQQDVLRLLTGHGDNAGKGVSEVSELRIDATLAGRAFREVRTLRRSGGDGDPDWWWVPLVDGTERLGVLRISAKDADEQAQKCMRHLATVIAFMVVSKRHFSDSYARLVRTRSMNVAAEMQWNLMPPLTFANDEVVIAAVLEPAYEMGGDAFEYAIAGDIVHMGIFDAMGHDVAAGLTANLAVTAFRNNRRQGVELGEISEVIESVLIAEFGRDTRFVTGILADLDTSTGMFSWVNRGHHLPVVIRGGRWVTTLQCPPAHPMGLDLGVPVTVCHEQLEPGDRVLLYSDGITEVRNRHGQEFGVARFTDFIIRAAADGLPVPETLRRLIHNVMEYHDGVLQDDATVLLAEWHGTAQRRLCP
ncbi:PP2C family protein-serine/threonine phosphatase [Sphaerisporangium sp. NPDC088356]|uniref:PP2C family protein-serine/threonine phosphatase n=1 Tax=Sphaerisporangium sp. NPDC088356 TaxID=3154871 RepID=UPI003432A8CD